MKNNWDIMFKFTIILYFFSLFLSCSEEKNISADKVFDIKIDTVHKEQLIVEFLNNSYELDEGSKFLIEINDTPIFSGYFTRSYDKKQIAYIPNDLIGYYPLRSTIYFQNNGRVQKIRKKGSFYINQNDQIIYIVFCQDNKPSEMYYIFTQEHPLF